MMKIPAFNSDQKSHLNDNSITIALQIWAKVDSIANTIFYNVAVLISSNFDFMPYSHRLKSALKKLLAGPFYEKYK